MKSEFNFSQSPLLKRLSSGVSLIEASVLSFPSVVNISHWQSHKFYLLFTTHCPLFYQSHHTLFHLGHDSNIGTTISKEG